MDPLRSCTNTQWNLLHGIISLLFSKVYVPHTIFEKKTVVLYNVLCFLLPNLCSLMRKNFVDFMIEVRSNQFRISLFWAVGGLS